MLQVLSNVLGLGPDSLDGRDCDSVARGVGAGETREYERVMSETDREWRCEKVAILGEGRCRCPVGVLRGGGERFLLAMDPRLAPC